MKNNPVFLEILRAELERNVIPDPASEMARHTAVLASRQLRRMLVDDAHAPALRAEAMASYRRHLPALHDWVDAELHARLAQALSTTDTPDWQRMEELLYAVTASLIAQEDEAPRKLAGQLVAIDARLRADKEQAWVNSNRPASATSDAANPASPPDDGHARLLGFIRQRFPLETALQIASVQAIPGGFSKQTLFVHLAHNLHLPATLVMRRDGPYDTTGSSVTMEFPVIEKMYHAGVAVPQAFAMDAAGEVYGKPFILLARAPGKTIGDFIEVKEPSRAVALDLARKLASLHAAPFDGLQHILAGGAVSTRERLLGEIQQHEVMWKSVVHHQAYVVQAALDWLRRNIHLAEGPRAVVHKDIGAHNMLVHDQQISVLLDWETAVIGTPAEDVAYTYYAVVQMMDWDEFLTAYEAAAGVALDRRQLDFYMLWASVRVAVGIYKLVDPVFGGQRASLPEYYLGDYFGQTLAQRIAQKLSELLA